jgi:hypothetical protein
LRRCVRVSCPTLVAKGEQRAGRSTACRVIGALVDPRAGSLRGHSTRSTRPDSRSKELLDRVLRQPGPPARRTCRCGLSAGNRRRISGAGNSTATTTRRFFDATRPLVFNATPDLGAARPDFLDRAVIVESFDIAADMRGDEAEFWRGFNRLAHASSVPCLSLCGGTQEAARGQARTAAHDG